MKSYSFVLGVLVALGGARFSHAQIPSDPVLQGTIETHVHSEEDNNSLGGGSMDIIEMAKRARNKGMRAILVKPMFFETATRAYLAQKMVPGVLVFGGITLNLSLGGVNPAAVDGLAALRLPNAKMIWLANVDAEGSVAASAQPNRPSTEISVGGKLTPQTLAVLDAIARHRFSLATSHASAEEALMLVREAGRRNIPVVVTHAAQDPILMTVDQMKQAAQLGAFIEHTALGQFKGSLTHLTEDFYRKQRRVPVEDTARHIREVGAEHTILATDFGQGYNANPPDGLKLFILQLKSQGITDRELDLMTRVNPAKLLRLDPQPLVR